VKPPQKPPQNMRPAAFIAISRCVRSFITATLIVFFAPANADTSSTAVVEQPRAFGHFLGDRLQQRVLLEQQGNRFQPIALPKPERLGVWIERLGARTDTDSTGRAWLSIEYQIINTAPTLSTIRLPAWEVKGSTGDSGSSSVLTVPAWSIHVAPLTPSGNPTVDTLRPDRVAPLIATEAIAKRLEFCLAVLALTLSSWLAWLLWRNRRTAAQQPFALAWRQLRGLSDTDATAWHTLHRAFDRCAHFAVQRSSLDKLFEAAPHLKSARPEIETFFTRSDALFFAKAPFSETTDIQGLCKKLRRLERRHEA
jgi:mxaA protein